MFNETAFNKDHVLKYIANKVIVPTIENGEEICIRLCFTFLFFSKENQVPQIVIRMSRVMYQIKVLSVVINSNDIEKF